MTTAADRLWDQLEGMGFEKEERPDGYLPALPRDITALTDQELMILYGRFVSWVAYAAMRRSTPAPWRRPPSRTSATPWPPRP